MATKLLPKVVEKLKGMGITSTTEEDARKKLLKILSTGGVEGVDGEPINSLMEMAVVFVEDDTETEDDETAEEEVVDDEEAEEEEAPKTKAKSVAKKGKAATTAVSDEEEEVEELAAEVKTKKPATKPAPTAKKAAPKAKVNAPARKRLEGKRWEELSVAEQEKALIPFRKLLPKDKFKIEKLQKSFTVKYLGKSSEQNIFKYHLLRLLNDGKLEGVFVSHRFKTPDDLEPFLAEAALENDARTIKQGDSCSYIHPYDQDEVLYTLKSTDFLKQSVDMAEKQDKKMKANHDKLESSLKGNKNGNGVASTKPPKGVTVAEIEEEEDDEVPAPKAKAKVAPKPAPKPAPKAVAKKAVAKKPIVEPDVEEEDEDEEEEVAVKTKPAVKKAVAKKK